MSRKILFSVSLMLVVFSLAFTSNDAAYQEGNESNKAPDFALKSTTGKTVKLSEYKGKIVILDFWATWCGPCRKGIPDLIDLQNKYKNDLVVIGISVDQDRTKKEVEPFIKNYGINYPIVYFDDKVIKDYGGIQSIPTSFIIDKEGNITNRHIGLYPKYIYEEEIKELLVKK
ncbi:MAG: TlpA family protein disulfide reductase [Ignavibacteriales bacterium]|nr:MAG: TlpA family protein disulfide reductase [Ignavibacteriales bacterium]